MKKTVVRTQPIIKLAPQPQQEPVIKEEIEYGKFLNLGTVETNPNMKTFQITDTRVGYVNTLRRMILTGVNSVAIRSDMNEKGTTSDVVVTKNTTPMTNEMLADRIGLLPIHVDNPNAWYPELFTFRLHVTNTSSESLDVFASDIEVLQKSADLSEELLLIPNNQFFHPDPITHQTALITVLKGKQSNQNPQTIELTARATVGIGREHIRFSPVSQCSYSYTIDTDEGRQKELFEKWLINNKKVEPKSLEADTEKGGKLQREFQTMEVQRCYLINDSGEPYSFECVVETIGVQTVDRIVDQALIEIEAKCNKYTNMVTKLPDSVQCLPADARMMGFDFIFQNEDHTLGNLLQTWMDQYYMDKGNELTFVGYKVPHPLRDEMVLRVGVNDGKELTAREFVAKAALGCAEMFRHWLTNWREIISEPMISRTVPSLKLTLANAKELEAVAPRGKPSSILSKKLKATA